MDGLVVNFIEAILLTLFMLSMIKVKRNKRVYICTLVLCDFGIITISNYMNEYDIYLTTIIIIITVIVSWFFSFNTIQELFLYASFEAVYSCLISCIVICISLVWVNVDMGFLKQCLYGIGILMIWNFLKKYKLNFSKEISIILSIILYLMHFILQHILQIYILIKVDIPEMIVTFVMLIFCVISLFILFFKVSKMHLLQEENKRLMQESDSRAVLSYLYDQLSIKKHDMKHNYDLLKYYMENDDYEKIKEHVYSKTKDVNKIPNFIQSKNRLLNAVLNSKIVKAKQKNILFQSYIFISEYINIDDSDFNDLLSNVLDNAIENNRYNGVIDVNIIEDQDILHIKIGNSVSSDTYSDNLITKKDKVSHGFGLKSIQGIVEKYNGVLKIEKTAEYFEMTITLPLV